MNIMPVHVAYDGESSHIVYIFSCPRRSYSIIFNDTQIFRLSSELDCDSPRRLMMLGADEITKRIKIVVDQDSVMWILHERGWTIASLSSATDIHPVELAMYFTSIGFMDYGTQAVIQQYTGNTDIPAIKDPLFPYAWNDLPAPFELGSLIYYNYK